MYNFRSKVPFALVSTMYRLTDTQVRGTPVSVARYRQPPGKLFTDEPPRTCRFTVLVLVFPPLSPPSASHLSPSLCTGFYPSPGPCPHSPCTPPRPCPGRNTVQIDQIRESEMKRALLRGPFWPPKFLPDLVRKSGPRQERCSTTTGQKPALLLIMYSDLGLT